MKFVGALIVGIITNSCTETENKSDSNNNSEVDAVFKYMDNVFVQIEEWKPNTEELNKYAGDFYSEELGTIYMFEVEDNSLIFHHRKLDSATLTTIFEREFSLDGAKITFSDNKNSFTISDGRVKGVLFTRK